MDLSRPKILVVDDEEAILETMTFTFEEDYEVFTSKDARHALEVIERNGPFAVVLSDQRMPDMSGVEFVAEVWKRHPTTVRMILTGFSDMDAILQAVNDGHVYAYITKPWEPDDLKQVMRRAVEHYRLSVENERLLVDLRRANRFLEALIDELDSGAIALDDEGVIQAVNRPVREYFGLTSDSRGRAFSEVLEERGLAAIGEAATAVSREGGEVTYYDVDVEFNRFRIKTRKLEVGGDLLGRVVLFREISHEPLQRRFNDLLSDLLAVRGPLRTRLEAVRDQLSELAEGMHASSIQSSGMTELAERISRARTSVGNWLDVDETMAHEDFPDAQVLQDRMRVSLSRWPLGSEVPARVKALADAVADYYESGEKTREPIL